MRLLRVYIIKADTCGGLLDGLDVRLRAGECDATSFDPFCLIGPNGAGKSQFLQALAEIFQSIFHSVVPADERLQGNPNLEFEVEYLIRLPNSRTDSHVYISRKSEGKKKPELLVHVLEKAKWKLCPLNEKSARELLPPRVIGYTSGGNETLSLPFLLSRAGYADGVATEALSESRAKTTLPETRLMLIDYGTHLEVLVSNLLIATRFQRTALLEHARLKSLNSFRCIVQLAHSAAPKALPRQNLRPDRKGIQLTDELERIIDQLQRCSTCWDYEPKDERYTFDFFVDGETSKAFGTFWKASIDLYSSLHKLAMLNDLAIPKQTRVRFKKDTEARRFASRLPEPQDEDKVFRFERVNFEAVSGGIVDYVSLSDGEHQLAQVLGTFLMISFPGVLFLLDEPESHFNPQWRVKLISRLKDLSTPNGKRRDHSAASRQDALMTTHAPFIPSDMARNRVLIFSKDETTGRAKVRLPDIETFGTTFEGILDECFDVRPPISQEPRDEISRLQRSKSKKAIKDGMKELGYSVGKAVLADRLRELEKKKVKA
jgi:restriction system-associated AAA family ATPase